jgi:sec-independent protein translocase protein TatB
MFPFEQGAFEMVVIGALALIIVGPKDLPVLMRKVGQFTAKMRGMAAEFRASFDELARQSELDELRKEVEALRTGTYTALHEPAHSDGAYIAPGLEAPPPHDHATPYMGFDGPPPFGGEVIPPSVDPAPQASIEAPTAPRRRARAAKNGGTAPMEAGSPSEGLAPDGSLSAVKPASKAAGAPRRRTPRAPVPAKTDDQEQAG